MKSGGPKHVRRCRFRQNRDIGCQHSLPANTVHEPISGMQNLLARTRHSVPDADRAILRTAGDQT
jgi:hypothetical protein